MGKYDDIIHLPHPVSLKHPRMSRQNRAAQFAPFAALTGYGDAVEETARSTQQRIELTDSRKEMLDEQLRLIRENLDQRPVISVEYFLPDARKAGGSYVLVTGPAVRLDVLTGTLHLQDGTTIPVEDIYDLQLPGLPGIQEPALEEPL